MATKTIYILYNANSSLLGKLSYSYRKLVCSTPENPACAACDITHGGLHLDETAAWKAAKAEIAQTGKGRVELRQLHRDELDGDVRGYVEGAKGFKYPTVLIRNKDGGEEGGQFEILMDNRELASLGGDAGNFVQRLREKDVFVADSTAVAAL